MRGRLRRGCLRFNSALLCAQPFEFSIQLLTALALIGDIAAHPETFRPDVGFAAYHDAMAIAEAGGLRPMAAHCRLGLARLHERVPRA